MNSFKQLETQLQVAQTKVDRATELIAAMRSSKFWKLREKWFRLKQKLGLPVEPELDFDLTVPPIAPADSYTAWTERNFPRQADLKRLTEVVDLFNYKPLLSVIMPVYNPPEPFLRPAIESVLNQVYPHWELCIADDASDQPHIRQILQEYADQDPRIKVIFRKENGHIVQASNSALKQAAGEFIITLDHDDLLAPDALYEVALLLNKQPDADMIYSDSDVMSADQNTGEIKRYGPAFKPDWCPDLFLSVMYTCHLGCYRRSLVERIGGYRPGFEGSQDYDLVLRLTEQTKAIFHIPKILYHWRAHADSVASLEQDVKAYAYVAAEKALAEALQRRGESGSVTVVPNMLGRYIVRYKIAEFGAVDIILVVQGTELDLDQRLSAIFSKTTYPNYHLTLVSPVLTNIIQKWIDQEPERLTHRLVTQPFNYSTLSNDAVKQTEGVYLLFLSAAVEVSDPGWIEAMVEQAQRPSIGAVGVLLLNRDRSIHHAGMLLGVGGIAANSHQNFPPEALGWGGWLKIVNNYSAVSGDCLMCRREVFERSGGFNPKLGVQYHDVDLCLKLLNQGLRNVYLPHVSLYYEPPTSSATSSNEVDLALASAYMTDIWKHFIEFDPCYNPNLNRTSGNYTIGY